MGGLLWQREDSCLLREICGLSGRFAMIFSSLEFLFKFLPVVLLLTLFLRRQHPDRAKIWLILASIFFYGAWRIEYTALLIGSLVGNFGLGVAISKCEEDGRRRWLTGLGIAANLLVLGYFKYTGFFLETIGHLGWWEWLSPTFKIALPLAISFFTFTQIAFLVDVCRDRTIRYSFGDYAFFVVFFPHLVAGPIVRHWEIIPQLREWKSSVSTGTMVTGVLLLIMGLSKKCLFADQLAPYADLMFQTAAAGQPVLPWDAWQGLLAFTLQIYFDFSGYSDMALGLALMFGFRFPVNFDSPYQARSIIEFWRRWHITLMRFFRDYVYFPLGGSRKGVPRTLLNVMIVMGLSGLWHGAGWTFIVWGLLHGLYLVVAHLWKDFAGKTPQVVQTVVGLLGGPITFLAVVWGWVWFRAADMATGWSLTLTLLDLPRVVSQGGQLIEGDVWMALVGLLLIVWFCPNSQQLLAARQPALEPVERPFRWQVKPGWISGVVAGILLFMVIKGLYGSGSKAFVYFDF